MQRRAQRVVPQTRRYAIQRVALCPPITVPASIATLSASALFSIGQANSALLPSCTLTLSYRSAAPVQCMQSGSFNYIIKQSSGNTCLPAFVLKSESGKQGPQYQNGPDKYSSAE